MRRSRKGRVSSGSRRSSIAPPYRLRRSVPPADVVKSRSDAGETIRDEPEEINAEEQFDASDSSQQERNQIDVSNRRSIENFEESSLSARQPQDLTNARCSESVEKWDEPGSRSVTETADSVPDDHFQAKSSGGLHGESAPEVEQSRAPEQAIDDSTAANFFSKRIDDSEPDRTHEQSKDAWESQYDSLPMTRGSRKAYYFIYFISGVVLLALGGLYLYGGPGERAKHAPQPQVEPGDTKSASGTAQTAPQGVDRVESKTTEMKGSKSDKTRETPRTDSDPNQVETEATVVSEKSETGDAPIEVSDESIQLDTSPVQPESVVDRDSCCGSIQEYQAALRLNPDDTEVLGKLAYFYLNKGMNQEAKRFAERTVNLDPKSSAGWIVMGAAFDAMNDHESALEAYRTCAEQAVGKYVTECRNLVR